MTDFDLTGPRMTFLPPFVGLPPVVVVHVTIGGEIPDFATAIAKYGIEKRHLFGYSRGLFVSGLCAPFDPHEAIRFSGTGTVSYLLDDRRLIHITGTF